MIRQPRPDLRLNVIGVTGQGKSFFRNTYQSGIYRCTLWNPLEDFNLGEIMTVSEYRENLEDMRRGPLRATVVPSLYDDEGMSEEFDALCAYVEEVGSQHFEIEEIALVTSPHWVPPYFNKLCIKGRHRAVSLGIYGQRFHQFPIIARGQSSEIIAFRQTEPDDVDDFNKRISPHYSPVPLNELPDKHFVHWTPERGAVYCRPLPLRRIENADRTRNARDRSGSDGSLGSGQPRQDAA